MLIKRCLESGEPFGIMSPSELIASRKSSSPINETAPTDQLMDAVDRSRMDDLVGCLVYVTSVKKMDHDTGISDVVITGTERFRIFGTPPLISSDAEGFGLAHVEVLALEEEGPFFNHGTKDASESKSTSDIEDSARASLLVARISELMPLLTKRSGDEEEPDNPMFPGLSHSAALEKMASLSSDPRAFALGLGNVRCGSQSGALLASLSALARRSAQRQIPHLMRKPKAGLLGSRLAASPKGNHQRGLIRVSGNR